MKLENAFKKLTKEGFSNINKIGSNTWATSKPGCAYGITIYTSMFGIERCIKFIKIWPVKRSEGKPEQIFKNLTQAIKYANAA